MMMSMLHSLCSMMQVLREGRWGHHRSGYFITMELPMHLLNTYTHWGSLPAGCRAVAGVAAPLASG